MALPGPNWRTENHLVTLTQGATTVLQNAYDGDGARVVRTANGQATHYVGGAHEYNVTTQTATTHCSFNGTPTAMKQGLTVTCLHHDQLGSLVSATSAVSRWASRPNLFDLPFTRLSRYNRQAAAFQAAASAPFRAPCWSLLGANAVRNV